MKTLLPQSRYWLAVPLLLIVAFAVLPFLASPHSFIAAVSKSDVVIPCDQRDFWGKSVCDPVAGYTGLLAIFTVALAIVGIVQVGFLVRADKAAAINAEVARRQMLISGQQADILEKQKEIARQEFLIVHRPRIRVRSIGFARENNPDQRSVGFSCVNIGGMRCRITSIQVMAQTAAGPVPSTRGDTVSVTVSGKWISSGEIEAYATPSLPIQYPTTTTWDFLGFVSYDDEAGVNRITGFWRRYNAQRHLFETPGDPDFNFEY